MLHDRQRIAKRAERANAARKLRLLAKPGAKSEHYADVIAHGASHVPAEFLVRRRGG
jgi:hypothetical protein